MAGLILTGGSMSSPEYRELRMRAVDKVQEASGVSAMLLFDAKDAFIEHDGPENHYRPYLMLHGRPAGVKAELPYHVSTLQYESDSDKRLMTYRYDFTRRNLQDLCAKGLFEQGFEPPAQVRTSRYELPCEISYAAFPPDAGEPNPENPPVVYASLQPGSLHCDDESSGYLISSYFEAMPEREAAPEMVPDKYVIDRESVRERSAAAFDKPEVELQPLPDPEGFVPVETPESYDGLEDEDDWLGGDGEELERPDEGDAFEPPEEPELPDEGDIGDIGDGEAVAPVSDSEVEDARVRAQTRKSMQRDAVNDAAEFAAAEEAARKQTAARKQAPKQTGRRDVRDMVVDGEDVPDLGEEFI